MAWTRELKTVWQVRFSDADRSPTETTVSIPKDEYRTKTAADKEAGRLQVLYDQGQFDPWVQDRPGEARRGHTTLLEAVRAYVDAKEKMGERGEKGGWSDATAQRYRGTLEKFARDVGPTQQAGRLTPEQIRDWTCRPDLSDASKRTYHGIVRAFVKWMRAEGVADVDMPPPLQHRKTVPSYATREELAKVCRAWPALAVHEAAKDDNPNHEPVWWYADAWRFAYWQALRKSEVVAIRCGGVDLSRMKLRVGDEAFVPKGKDEQVIPLVEPAAKIARAWKEGAAPSDRLFRHKTGDYMSAAFTRAREHALPEKPGLTLHGLRHGRCVGLLEQGLRVHVVQRFMRHKSLDATMRYVQVADRSLQEELQGLEESGLDV
jgi:integrase